MMYSVFLIILFIVLPSVSNAGKKADYSIWPPKSGTRYYSNDSTYWAEVTQSPQGDPQADTFCVELHSAIQSGYPIVMKATLPHRMWPYRVIVSDSAKYVVSIGSVKNWKQNDTAPQIVIFDHCGNVIHEFFSSETGDLSQFDATKGGIPDMLPPDYIRWWDSTTIESGLLIVGEYSDEKFEGYDVSDGRIEINLETGQILYDSRL